MNIIEYWRARRAMKALLKIVENPQPHIENINRFGAAMRDSMLILRGKEAEHQAEPSTSASSPEEG